jgi:recombination associated protein RdgC
MFFKNAAVYKITDEEFTANLSTSSIDLLMAERRFSPCSALQETSSGWEPPFSSRPDQLTIGSKDAILFCLKTEVKMVPYSSVLERLKDEIHLIETDEGRKLPAKERSALKDKILVEMLPKALSRFSKTNAYIDKESGFVIVDASTAGKAEDLLSQLRKITGQLPVVPLKNLPMQTPKSVMTSWLAIDHPANLSIGDNCELKGQEEKGATLRCNRQDLKSEEILNHLNNGKIVSKVACVFKDRIGFKISENLLFNRLQFLEGVIAEVDDQDPESEEERNMADFIIMTAELSELIQFTLKEFGAEQ